MSQTTIYKTQLAIKDFTEAIPVAQNTCNNELIQRASFSIWFISKILKRRGFAGSLHYFWYVYCRHGRLRFVVPESQRSGTGNPVSKYPGESAKRVLQRAFDQITILRQFLKSTRVCWYITNSLHTFRAKTSFSLAKNFLIFPYKVIFFFSSTLWFQLLTKSHATSMAVGATLVLRQCRRNLDT